jgi:hypothetical protein
MPPKILNIPPKKNTLKNNAPNMEPINFYELESVKKFMPEIINPYYDMHHIKVPFRSVCIGSSGAGKTTLLLNLISVMSSTFSKMYIYTKEEEPLYNYLQSVISEKLLSIHYGIDSYYEFDEKKYIGEQNLVVFDDMVNESVKKQKCISELYIRGRKMNVSTIYLSQSYFRIPKIIRSQCNYIFIIKISGVKDLRLILSEYALTSTVETMQNMYKHCCNDEQIQNFMLIDLQAKQDKTFRKNFIEFLT